MVGFEWTAAKFFWFYFVNFFSFCYFTYYGMMTVAITPNHQVAAIFAAAFYALFNLFSGFFIPKPVSQSFILALHLVVIQNLLFANFLWVQNFRGFQSGGYGTTGFARWHGLSMD